MIKSFEHVGMVTGHMDRSLAFYCDLLGLRLRLRKTMANGTEVAFLDTGNGMLEIFAPPDGAAAALDLAPATSGVLHITFLVDSVDESFAKLEAAGAAVRERPRPAVNSEIIDRVAFLRDPDGITVELAERRNELSPG
ncbi:MULTISPECIES: VOC family protein [unclassified Rhizobium]|uniref:VOC family protein n=1 Tax=unclassified Rhizobium TaxID=2613769 RepID=UPI00161C1981|nr:MULTISPECIES: VOC family protein [unclassified Rhizobium]MBB3318832.1 glyoxylase I family protein [Rhizobium sp. BK181]MBB3543165.1 glyoxylase I family protein [Rhizobium sp. BK399]MCS3742380.1 glyoxylase I family protein [Rhizobium sp. BK661]MCS4094792.1 glyoxylase I family protein [Rhizobium sp. BK176]